MNRRRLLAASAASLATGVAGCSAVGMPANSEPPDVEASHVEAVAAECQDPDRIDQTATATYDPAERRLSMTGLTRAESPCAEPAIHTHTGVGRSEYADASIHVSVDFETPIGDCEPCPTAMAYDGTATFEYDPAALYVYHVVRTQDAWRRVGPLAEASVG